MDCYEWRNCDADCENCEVANMDIARAVQTWTDADFMTYNYSPEEILIFLRQLGERAERAEQERDELREALRLNMASFKKASEDSGGCPFTCNTDDCQDCIHARSERETRRALGGE